MAERRRLRAEQQEANGGNEPNGTDADKPVVEVRQVAKPAWIPGMSEKDRLQAQNTNGEIMSKAALRNKQKRERKKLRHNHLELV